MNSKLIQINLFSCNHRASRFPFTIKAVEEIQKTKNCEKLLLAIHGESDVIQKWLNYFNNTPPKTEIKLIQYSDSTYTDRVKTAHSTGSPYSCKLDDDVLISSHVWDYMIDNIHRISEKHPVMSPILTNGIPSVELFVEDFFDEQDKKVAHSLFLNTYIPNLWGLNYSGINDKIADMKQWNGREYWDFVTKVDTGWQTSSVPWYYFMVRGVHPARFSMEYNLFVAHKIGENKDRFFNPKNLFLDTFEAPYFTNNIFISTTKFWRESLSLFDDGWDEGQMSLRMLMDKSSVLYVRNGFGIHMAYGMTEGFSIIENTYMGLL